jgi:hypothetical protein
VVPTEHTSFGCVCLTPDGRHVAWGHADGTIRVWDVDADREVKQLPFVKGEMQALAFSPDGQRLLATTSGGAMRLWDARTGKLLDDYPAPSGVRVVAFTPDGRHVVAGHYDGHARLYRLPDAPAPEEEGIWGDAPRAIRSVRVPIFKTPSVDNELAFDVTRAVIREIEGKTSFKVAALWVRESDRMLSDDADSELTGVVRAAGKPIWPNTWGIKIAFVWKDRHTGKTILGGPDRPVILEVEKSYDPELGESIATA